MTLRAENTTKEKMSYSTMNSTTTETSTNYTTHVIRLLDSLDMCVYSINFLFVFLHTPILYGSSSQGQEDELHQTTLTSICLFVRLVSA